MPVDNENGKYKLNVEQRITRLETVVDEIKNNHLKHIEEKIDRAQWLLIVTMGGVIIDLALRFA